MVILFSARFFHDIEYFAYHFRIQCGSRFIEEHDFRIHRQCSRDSNSSVSVRRKETRIFSALSASPTVSSSLRAFSSAAAFFHTFDLDRCQVDYPVPSCVETLNPRNTMPSFFSNLIDIHIRIIDLPSHPEKLLHRLVLLIDSDNAGMCSCRNRKDRSRRLLPVIDRLTDS